MKIFFPLVSPPHDRTALTTLLVPTLSSEPLESGIAFTTVYVPDPLSLRRRGAEKPESPLRAVL